MQRDQGSPGIENDDMIAMRCLNSVARVLASKNDSSSNLNEVHWRQYFEKLEEWWDNRIVKRYPRGPDFKHKNSK